MLEKGLKEHIQILVTNEEEQLRVGNNIHFQLVGNKDYIDNNIVLNIDSPYEVNLYVFEDCRERPTITI